MLTKHVEFSESVRFYLKDGSPSMDSWCVGMKTVFVWLPQPIDVLGDSTTISNVYK